jgi:hypothetical protein
MGDGLLPEFPFRVTAVEKMMDARNADTSEAKRVVYRVGVNLGDVLINGDDIRGYGVNIVVDSRGSATPTASLSPASFMIKSTETPAHFPEPRSAKTEEHREAGRGICN